MGWWYNRVTLVRVTLGVIAKFKNDQRSKINDTAINQLFKFEFL